MTKINENTNFFRGFELALKNAHNHLAVAEASQKISYGIANSHLILATEEAIKAAMLFQLSIDKAMLAEALVDFDKYFSSHKYKHEAIRNYELFGGLIENLLNLILAPFKDVDPETETDEEFAHKKNEGLDNMISWLEDMEEDRTTLDTNQDWWKQADNKKNLGFYVSLLKKKGQWEGPLSISEKQYSKSKKIATEFINKISILNQSPVNPEMTKMYQEMKDKLFKKK